MPAANKKLTLYWNPLCPFVHRALISMEEKGAADVPERVFIPLDRDAPEWYRKINPRETVPTLVVEGEPTVFESAFVAEYFDRTFGQPNQLFPTLPEARAQIRDFQSISGDVVGSLYSLFFTEEAKRPEAAKKAREAVAKLEEALAKSVKRYGGPFFLGQAFSMADIHIVPFLQRFAATLPAYRDFQPLAEAPHLQRLLDAAQLRPSVYKTSQTPAEYIRGYATYGGGDAASVKPKVRLNPASPFNQRVTVAAALGGLEVEVTEVTGAQALSDRLPSVEIAGHKAFDSNSAMQYLLESARQSEKPAPLIPTNDTDYSRAQFVAQEGDNIGSALVFALKKDAGDDARKELRDAIEFTEQNVSGADGFAVGDSATFADAVLIPHLARVVRADAKALDAAPKLKRILDRGLQTAGVKAIIDAVDDSAFQAFVDAQ